MKNVLNKNKPNFIFVIGGVISGLGKGIFTASLAKLLQLYGLKINPIKIDPYLNVDAGTMRPTEHGEVWVTYDGGEIDQDLGNYERFLHIPISKNNNITSGKILYELINAERQGKFLGKTVQYIPHAVNFIEQKLIKIHKQTEADITIIEVGGTVGDYESALFLHTINRMQRKYNVVTIFMGYILFPPHIHELKTKPFQHALNNLFSYGIFPNFLILRSAKKIDKPRIEKISAMSNISEKNIIPIKDTKNKLEIPIILKRYNIHKSMLKLLNIKIKEKSDDQKFKKYKEFVNKINILQKKQPQINVGLIGKYIKSGKYALYDTYISVLESIKYAGYALDINVKIKWIDSTQITEKTDESKLKPLFKDIHAIIVPGGFGSTGIYGKLKSIQYARENKIPYLGLCYGLQLATIEFTRNVIGLKNANTTEINPKTPHPVIDILPEQKQILKQNRYGATMRLGEYRAIIKPNTIVFDVYNQRKRLKKEKSHYYVIERHRHRYEVNPKYHKTLQKYGLIFSGMSPDKKLVEFIELPKNKHPYFVATQAHPEFTSYINDPNPLFWGLLKTALSKT